MSGDNNRKISIRSKMSDEELSLLIEKAKKQFPESFSRGSGDTSRPRSHYVQMSSVNEVISKWL